MSAPSIERCEAGAPDKSDKDSLVNLQSLAELQKVLKDIEESEARGGEGNRPFAQVQGFEESIANLEEEWNELSLVCFSYVYLLLETT